MILFRLAILQANFKSESVPLRAEELSFKTYHLTEARQDQDFSREQNSLNFYKAYTMT